MGLTSVYAGQALVRAFGGMPFTSPEMPLVSGGSGTHGGLYGLTIERFGRIGVTSARNSTLVRICQYVRLIDGTTNS